MSQVRGAVWPMLGERTLPCRIGRLVFVTVFWVSGRTVAKVWAWSASSDLVSSAFAWPLLQLQKRDWGYGQCWARIRRDIVCWCWRHQRYQSYWCLYGKCIVESCTREFQSGCLWVEFFYSEGKKKPRIIFPRMWPGPGLNQDWCRSCGSINIY